MTDFPELTEDYQQWLADLADDMIEPAELFQAMRAGLDNLIQAAVSIHEADKHKQWTYKHAVKGPPNSRLHIGEGQTPGEADVFKGPPQTARQPQAHTVQHRLGKGETGK